jgi:hypothetical protein
VVLLDCGRNVLVSDWQSLGMRTIQGELLHTPSPQRGHRGLASSANKFFLRWDDDDRDSITNLDLVTGAVENRVVSLASGAWTRYLLMKMFGNLLVVLRAHIVDKDGRLIRHHEQGLYAFDLNDFSKGRRKKTYISFTERTSDYFRADC